MASSGVHGSSSTKLRSSCRRVRLVCHDMEMFAWPLMVGWDPPCGARILVETTARGQVFLDQFVRSGDILVCCPTGHRGSRGRHMWKIIVRHGYTRKPGCRF